MNAGVVVYREQGSNGLVGQWTHQKIEGAIGREIIQDATFLNIQGNWPVSIYPPEGNMAIFIGTLTIEPLGSALQLKWEGTSISGQAQAFEGVGILLPRDKLLTATFEEING